MGAEQTGLIDETGLLRAHKPTYGGSILAEIVCKTQRPQMVTVRPGVFRSDLGKNKKKPANSSANTAQTEVILLPEDLIDERCQIIKETVEPGASCVTLEHAAVIICGGRGMGDAQTFNLCSQLAAALGGVAAGTRPVAEDGWISREYQIGLSGKSVAPKLLICCGVSGAASFTIGIEKAETVVAINKDPEAPIFHYAHYGIVGDVREVIPQLISSLSA